MKLYNSSFLMSHDMFLPIVSHVIHQWLKFKCLAASFVKPGDKEQHFEL